MRYREGGRQAATNHSAPYNPPARGEKTRQTRTERQTSSADEQQKISRSRQNAQPMPLPFSRGLLSVAFCLPPSASLLSLSLVCCLNASLLPGLLACRPWACLFCRLLMLAWWLLLAGYIIHGRQASLFFLHYSCNKVTTTIRLYIPS